MLEEEEMKDAILLVLANKQDLDGAMSAAEIADQFGLSRLKSRTWTIQKCSAVKGEGLESAMDWLTDNIAARS
jgi:ADP-ribosylation factor-like protein 1